MLINGKNAHGKGTWLGKWSGIAVALAAVAIIVPGCITAAVTTAVIYAAGTTQYTAKVQIPASPDKVYGAMLRILERRSDITVGKRDDVNRKLEISKGKNKASAQVDRAGIDLTELKVTARENETDASHKELAMRVVQQVCDELGVRYEVIEKK